MRGHVKVMLAVAVALSFAVIIRHGPSTSMEDVELVEYQHIAPPRAAPQRAETAPTDDPPPLEIISERVAPPPKPPSVEAEQLASTAKPKRKRRRPGDVVVKTEAPRATLVDDSRYAYPNTSIADDIDDGFAPPKFANDKCPPFDRTMWSIDADFDAEPFCAKYGETALARGRRPLIYYGIMFGYEFDMLEIVLHEIYPIVDKIVFAESTLTHSLDTKPTFFHHIQADPRFQPYLKKMVNYTFLPRQKFKSGWDIERKQRKFGLKGAFDSGIRNGDILVGNMDLDEPFQAHYLMRLKYCNVKSLDFYQFHFRYNLNCLQFNLVSLQTGVNFKWGADSLRIKDLYKMRPQRTYVNITSADFIKEVEAKEGRMSWHMSTFGTMSQMLRKLQNSPHRFLVNNTREKVTKDVTQCHYGGVPMWKIIQKKSLLPKFIQQNFCHFRKRGWLPGETLDG